MVRVRVGVRVRDGDWVWIRRPRYDLSIGRPPSLETV